MFLIDYSNEQVIIPVDGSFEFIGPTRVYDFEAKASVELTDQWNHNTQSGASFRLTLNS